MLLIYILLSYGRFYEHMIEPNYIMCCNRKGCCGKGCGCSSSKIGRALVLIGGLNWGLVGLGMFFGGSNWNLINIIFGGAPTLESIIYILVGISAVMMLMGCKCKKCTAQVCDVHGVDMTDKKDTSTDNKV